MTLSLQTLLILAGGQQDDLTKYLNVGLSPSIKAAIERKQAHAQEKAADEAAEQILELLKDAQSHVDSCVQAVRRARAEEATNLKRIKQFERAKLYALETNNFLPLAAQMGLVSYSSHALKNDQDKLAIPDDWQPSKPTDTQP